MMLMSLDVLPQIEKCINHYTTIVLKLLVGVTRYIFINNRHPFKQKKSFKYLSQCRKRFSSMECMRKKIRTDNCVIRL